MTKRQNSIIVQTILALMAAEILALSAVVRVGARQAAGGVQEAAMAAISAPQLLSAFFLSTLLLLFFIRVLRRSRIVFEALFALSIFLGNWAFFEVYWPSAAFFAALFVAVLRYGLPRIIVHNLVLITALAGISAAIGRAISWQSMIMVLSILAVYDVISVYGTRHMVTTFKGLLERGVVFALVIPERPRQLFARLRSAKAGEGFFFLGSGDVALPTLFVASAAREGITLGIGAAVGALVGLFFTDILFEWGRKRPMPALPPIALGTMAGFFSVMLA